MSVTIVVAAIRLAMVPSACVVESARLNWRYCLDSGMTIENDLALGLKMT